VPLLCSPLPTAPPTDAHFLEPTPELTAETLWNEVSTRLQGALSTTYAIWFSDVTAVDLSDDAFVLALPNEFMRDQVEEKYRGLIHTITHDVMGRDCRIQLTVVAKPEVPGVEPAEAEPPARRAGEAQLNPKYSFDLFVIGSSNRFAHAAALAVAEAPAQAYNPLFIYGGTGLGKTHLMQAIAQYVGQHTSRLEARYVTSETFMNDFINSLRDKRIEGFKHRYRNYDLLLVDDIQFFEAKERIQEEFFHTFNSLYEQGAQIVLSSDRPPREIATLEARLRSRFEWGLITDVQPPDLETRIAILRKKVKTDGIHVPDEEVLSFIAGRIDSNIRELEGALTRVVAFSSLTGRPMTSELAQEVLKDVFPQGEAVRVTIARIQEMVSDRFGISLDELKGSRRSQDIVYPRQVAMYLSRELTDASLPKIGKEFGGRDHTTVMHANAKIARQIRQDRSVYNLVQELTARVKQVQ
jgi:chromosomal replication initiator protein